MSGDDVAAIIIVAVWVVGMIPALYLAGRYNLADGGADPFAAFVAVLLWPVALVAWGVLSIARCVYRAGERAGRS